MRKRHTAEQRERLIGEVRAGERVAVAAARMGVGVSAAYLWVKEAGAPPKGPTFARVVPSVGAAAGVVLEVGRVRVQVQAGFDAAVLRQVVSALSEES
jgi:transposase-like protein